MVLYTAATVAQNTTADHMKARIQQAITEMNWSFDDSGVNTQIYPALVEMIDYANEGLPLSDTRKILTDSPESGTAAETLDCVHPRRDSVGADLVILVVNKPGFVEAESDSGMFATVAGGTYAPPDPNKGAAQAFAVVTEQGLTASGNYFFAHELGHLMGENHEWNPAKPGAYPFSHGHTNTASTGCNAWRTLMGQDRSCGPPCDWIRLWSNPVVAHCGLPTGNANENNAASLNLTRHMVANFRCGTPQPANAWMKDTWDDSGLEPDPKQAGTPMWKSPAIWVRNAQDGVLKQHQHQNPVAGQTNWVYVKLHNGAPAGTPAIGGELELYVAQASTSLTWPTDWQLAATQPIASFDANSTRVIEIPWISPPGQFSMVARWASAADPMATAEGPDLEANVRLNNNLAWRSLHDVDLTQSSNWKADISVSADPQAPATYEIEFRAPPNAAGRSFLSDGRLRVTVDRGLARTLRVRGAQPAQPNPRDVREFWVGPQGAVLLWRNLDAGAQGRLHLTFSRRWAKPRNNEFQVDVIQYRRTMGRRELIGAVSYTVRVGRR
jgi:Metallo-peptidase family M12B Reprolysin-like